MATKRRKKATVIDTDIPLKKNELSLDYMMAYIEDKVDEDKQAQAKADFKAVALDSNGDYQPKQARDYFEKTYPTAVKKPEKKGAKKAKDKLADW